MASIPLIYKNRCIRSLWAMLQINEKNYFYYLYWNFTPAASMDCNIPPLWFRLKYLKTYLMDCHPTGWILITLRLWCSLNFSTTATSQSKSLLIQQNISASNWWIGTTFRHQMFISPSGWLISWLFLSQHQSQELNLSNSFMIYGLWSNTCKQTTFPS